MTHRSTDVNDQINYHPVLFSVLVHYNEHTQYRGSEPCKWNQTIISVINYTLFSLKLQSLCKSGWYIFSLDS